MQRLIIVIMSLSPFMLASCSQQTGTNPLMIKRENFQVEYDGNQVDLFTLKNAQGMTVQVTNYGGKVVSILVPDRNGKLGDVNLGYESAEATINGNASLGATIGRYANRIAGGQFELNGQLYQLFKNNGPNTLHGGKKGYRFVMWEGKQIDDATVELSYLSHDGEEGFPGNLHVKVVFSVTDENELKLEYSATTDKPTVLNLTNHAFFNLKGEGQGDILDHVLWVNADRFLPTDDTGIPTGEYREVKGTPFDFRSPKSLGRDIALSNKQLTLGRGYDSPNQAKFPSTVLNPGETFRSVTVYRFSAM
jgi:aldose 1-epimerase